MEKSIETIWKEGFLQSEALLAPKLNNLYTQKSVDLVEKFRRRYKINRIAIIVFACILLPVSFITNMPYMGIPMSLVFIAISFIANKFSKRLDDLDKTTDSYHYLLSFDRWINDLVSVNTRLSRYLYPVVFICMFAGFWFGSIGGDIPGDKFINFLLARFPGTWLVFGFPVVVIAGAILSIALLAIFGGKIGKWDLNLAYGGLKRKLDEILAEMEELRAGLNEYRN